MRRVVPALFTIATLASCVAPPPRAVTPPPAPPPLTTVPAAPPPVALGPDWNDWPRTPGTWRYAREGGGSVARFTAGVSISCGADRRMWIRLDGRAGPSSLTIRTSSMTRVLAPAAVDTGIAATLAPTDPLLDAIAFSRGRFTIERAGSAPLVLPPYAEIDRVVEDCRG